jgi:hypothetical protein
MLKELYINLNPKLKLGENLTQSIFSLYSIRNIYTSKILFEIEKKYHLFKFKNSIKLNEVRKMNDRAYFQSININYVPRIEKYQKEECRNVLFFIRSNIHFNIKSDDDFSKLLRECFFQS